MADVKIGIASVGEVDEISRIDLSFESNFVWTTQLLEDVDAYTAEFRKNRIPKTITIPFQAYPGDSLEMMVMRQEILSVRYEEQVIGYLRLEYDELVNRILLKTGGIMPEYRNKGVGASLLNYVADLAKQNGIYSVVAMVQAKNDPAIRFLLNRGFLFCGYQEFYYPNMEIGLSFSRKLR